MSTATNKNSASISRQKRAAEGATSRDKVEVVKNVTWELFSEQEDENYQHPKRTGDQARATVAAARASNTKLKLGQLTQEGVPKSCGTKSILQTLGSLSTTTKANLEKAIGDRVCGKFGWQTLKSKMSKILKVDIGSHETARCIAAELKHYK